MLNIKFLNNDVAALLISILRESLKSNSENKYIVDYNARNIIKELSVNGECSFHSSLLSNVINAVKYSNFSLSNIKAQLLNELVSYK